MCCSNRFKTVAVIGLHEKLTTECVFRAILTTHSNRC